MVPNVIFAIDSRLRKYFMMSRYLKESPSKSIDAYTDGQILFQKISLLFAFLLLSIFSLIVKVLAHNSLQTDDILLVNRSSLRSLCIFIDNTWIQQIVYH